MVLFMPQTGHCQISENCNRIVESSDPMSFQSQLIHAFLSNMTFNDNVHLSNIYLQSLPGWGDCCSIGAQFIFRRRIYGLFQFGRKSSYKKWKSRHIWPLLTLLLAYWPGALEIDCTELRSSASSRDNIRVDSNKSLTSFYRLEHPISNEMQEH